MAIHVARHAAAAAILPGMHGRMHISCLCCVGILIKWSQGLVIPSASAGRLTMTECKASRYCSELCFDSVLTLF